MNFLSQLYQRFFGVGEWKTTGPDPAEYPLPTVGDILHVAEKANSGEFKDGIWSLATYRPMHPGRIGRAIVPRTLVVHTTDMRPGTFDALVRSWTTQPGRGNGAHFLIGKSELDGGIIQFAPVHRNANHAGGTNPGSIGGLHPNTCSVGVEIHAAGRLKKVKGLWWDSEMKQVFPEGKVYVDERGRGWERVTQYQLDMTQALFTALRPVLKPCGAKDAVQANGDYTKNGVGYFASPVAPQLIGHVSINPVNKTDPGPQVMKEMSKWV